MSDKIDGGRFLLVEGYSDQVFLRAMLDDLGVGSKEGGAAKDCVVEQFGGRTKLLDQIETWINPEKLRDAKAIGILLDADTSATATRQSLRDRLLKVTGLGMPECGGWLRHSEGAWVGFHVVPGKGPDDQGEIETLVWRSLVEDPAQKPTLECVESFLACRKERNGSIAKIDKARVAAFLSTLTPDDPRLGPGARAKQFDLGAAAFKPLRDFLLGMKGL